MDGVYGQHKEEGLPPVRLLIRQPSISARAPRRPRLFLAQGQPAWRVQHPPGAFHPAGDVDGAVESLSISEGGDGGHAYRCPVLLHNGYSHPGCYPTRSPFVASTSARRRGGCVRG